MLIIDQVSAANEQRVVQQKKTFQTWCGVALLPNDPRTHDEFVKFQNHMHHLGTFSSQAASVLSLLTAPARDPLVGNQRIVLAKLMWPAALLQATSIINAVGA